MFKKLVPLAMVFALGVAVSAQDKRAGHPATRSEFRLLEAYSTRRAELQRMNQVLSDDEADLTASVRARLGLPKEATFHFNNTGGDGFQFGSWDLDPVTSGK